MKWFLNRMSEGSTWAGLAALLPTVLQVVATGQITPAGVSAIVGGVAAVLIKEKGGAGAAIAG